MSETLTSSTAQKPALHGLSCPRCGGMVAIPEGQAVVICPYCDLRSSVSGERGMRRYQAPLRVARETALAKLGDFLSSNWSMARDARRKAQLSEAFLVHLPFWAAWGRGVAWAFGQQRVGSGDNKRYEPREKRVVKEMSWNGPACEVGEFGVRQIGLHGCPLEPFDAERLHRTGLVFEPVGSAENALEAARREFEQEVKGSVKLSQTAQLFTRLIRPRLGLVYYPMWVLRYLYNGRSFQVVVDGYDGQVLYGKAPGSVFFRAASLVAGMAAGAVIAVDGAALGLYLGAADSDSEGIFGLALASLVIGGSLMYAAFRKYRYGEHYEYHRFKGKLSGINFDLGGLDEVKNIAKQLEELT